jgi:hypothetical protein
VERALSTRVIVKALDGSFLFSLSHPRRNDAGHSIIAAGACPPDGHVRFRTGLPRRCAKGFSQGAPPAMKSSVRRDSRISSWGLKGDQLPGIGGSDHLTGDQSLMPVVSFLAPLCLLSSMDQGRLLRPMP